MKINWLIYFTGLPIIFGFAIKGYLMRDKLWCKVSEVGFKRILGNEINLWKLCCQKELLNDDQEA